VTPPPPRGGFCVPSTAAAAIDYLKRSAACPGKLRHLHAVLPNPTLTVLSPRPRRRQRGPTAKQCDTADTAARTCTPTPAARADRRGGKNRTPSPSAPIYTHTYTHTRHADHPYRATSFVRRISNDVQLHFLFRSPLYNIVYVPIL